MVLGLLALTTRRVSPLISLGFSGALAGYAMFGAGHFALQSPQTLQPFSLLSIFAEVMSGVVVTLSVVDRVASRAQNAKVASH